MIAEEGKTYAQVINGKAHWIFTRKELIEWNDKDTPAVDVTGNIPNVGDSFDGVNFISAPIVNLPMPKDLSDLDNANKILVAACIYLGNLSGKTPAQVKAGIKAVYNSLP